MMHNRFAVTLLAALLSAGASIARAEQGLVTHKAPSLDMALAIAQGSLEATGMPVGLGRL